MKLQQSVTIIRDGLASVPPTELAKQYIHRNLPGGVSDFDLFDFAREQAINILIEGPTGPGKTTAVRAYAADRGYRFYRVSSSNGTEESKLFGKPIINEERTSADDPQFVWQDGPVTDLVRNGGVLLINEGNFIPERVSTVLFALLDEGREIQLVDHKGEVIKAHRPPFMKNGVKVPCWCDLEEDECKRHWLLVVMDMNPDYEGTRPLNKALRNRFGIQLWWDYDSAVEAKLIQCKSLRQMGDQLRAEVAKGLYETPVSTNMLMEFEKIAVGVGVPFAVQNFVNHFGMEERPSVKVVCDTWAGDLENDINNLRSGKKPSAKQQQTTQYGENLIDPEWGVYGRDWVYEDEEVNA